MNASNVFGYHWVEIGSEIKNTIKLRVIGEHAGHFLECAEIPPDLAPGGLSSFAEVPVRDGHRGMIVEEGDLDSVTTFGTVEFNVAVPDSRFGSGDSLDRSDFGEAELEQFQGWVDRTKSLDERRLCLFLRRDWRSGVVRKR